MRITLSLGLLLALGPTRSVAEVVRIEITRRADVLGGRSFGPAGSYQSLEGRVLFALDPANRFNSRIVDLGLARRNAQGRVEFWADFAALVPTRPARDNVVLLEVSNRGLVYVRNVLDFGSMAPRIATDDDLGDGLLLRMGLTMIWVGWQHDVPDDPDRFGIDAPIATAADGSRITGLLRADWVIQRPTTTLSLAHGGAIAYPVVDPDDAATILTVRDGRYAPRRVVPRAEWRFGRADDGGKVSDDPRWIAKPTGFEPGKIYELVYRGADPKVAGVGLAAIRDVISYLKYSGDSLFRARRAVGFGISQTGRLLRHFLYQGFNTDERGRQVFDGLLIHVAGAGRGSFNHRFAQPSRDAHRFDTFFYPTDLFPFASASTTDPVTGIRDGLNQHLFDSRHLPKVVQTNTGYEYWGRAASLIHTTPDGRADLGVPENERIYHLAGGQHVPAPFPPAEATRHPDSRAYRGNPLDYRLPLRAVFVSLVRWVRDAVPPPPSAYPRIDRHQLATIDGLRWRLPADVAGPLVVHQPDRVDYGPSWGDGRIDREPPLVTGQFPVRVPEVDSLGNEVGGFRSVEVDAPLASYLAWNQRAGQPGDQGELTRILGTWLPFPRSEEERAARQDPRPTIGTLYRDRAAYQSRVDAVVTSLIRRRMLLPADAPRAKARAMASWDWLATQ